jgi:hypothetical protein
VIERRLNDHCEWGVAGIMALLLTFIVGGVATAVLFVVIPKDNQTLVTQVTTALFGGWMLMLGYFYGTTQTQGRKDAALLSQAKTIESAQSTLSAVSAPAGTVTLAPGDVATATVSPTGTTTIEKEPDA